MGLATIDIIVIAIHAVVIFGLAQFVTREKDGEAKNSSDYFLASKSLPWWAIAIVLSLVFPPAAGKDRVSTDGISYKTTSGFNIASCAVTAILVVFYTT